MTHNGEWEEQPPETRYRIQAGSVCATHGFPIVIDARDDSACCAICERVGEVEAENEACAMIADTGRPSFEIASMIRRRRLTRTV